jgi:hypothetical protein
MDGNVIGAVIGVVASGVMALIGYNNRRQGEHVEKITSSIANIEKVVTEIRIELPTKYVTKDEMLRHIDSGQKWQNHVDDQLIQIREEISTLRDWSHRR